MALIASTFAYLMPGTRFALFTLPVLAVLAATWMQQTPVSPFAKVFTSLAAWHPFRGRRLFPGATRSSPAPAAAVPHTAAQSPPLAAAEAAQAATMPAPGAASVRHIPASKLTISKPTWWLESRFHFR